MKAILLVDHGSQRHAANDMLREIAELVRQQQADVHVEIAHMELAEPSIEQGFAACVAAGATEVIVHPYMLAPGRHSTEDIPRLAADAAQKHPGVKLGVSAPLGVHPLMAEMILERVNAVELG